MRHGRLCEQAGEQAGAADARQEPAARAAPQERAGTRADLPQRDRAGRRRRPLNLSTINRGANPMRRPTTFALAMTLCLFAGANAAFAQDKPDKSKPGKPGTQTAASPLNS